MKKEEIYEQLAYEGLRVIIMDLLGIESVSMGRNIGLDYSVTHSDGEEMVHLATQWGYIENGDFYNQNSSLIVRLQGDARAQKYAFKKLLPHDKIMEAVNNGYTEVYQIAEYWDLPYDFTERACFYDINGYLMPRAV